ncbi:chitobiase/beta-hexosaminidase C-terminal domain-containing protein [Phosphitispora sp. TUW77]|uniref:chitobiase/beta-hexosaminidase C-terminal domain-containing protein n=1 Tax=Phosphitispora sp. TUW77 TaxID=3152361 RepID=UPI003AB6A327
MAWTAGDLKIFAAGLAIGAKYNHTHGTLPRVKASVAAGTYSSVFYVALSCDLEEAIIMYSTDGGTPTTEYAGEEIFVDDDLTIYAYAVYRQNLSPMSKFDYVIYVPEANVEETLTTPDGISDEVVVEMVVTTQVATSETLDVAEINISDEVEVVVNDP